MCQPGGPCRWAVPTGLAVLLRFPQNEIAGVGLVVFVHVDAGAGADAAEIVVRKLAVAREIGDAVVDGTIAEIGVAALAELFDGGHHILDVVGGFDDALGALQAQGCDVFEESLGVVLGVLEDRLVRRRRRRG